MINEHLIKNELETYRASIHYKFHYILNIHPKEKAFILNLIEKHGYIAGGTIRSILENSTPNDIDIFFDNDVVAAMVYGYLKYQADIASTNGLTFESCVVQFDRITGYGLPWSAIPGQFIIKVSGDAEKVVSEFDFTNCMGFYKFSDKTLYISPKMQNSILTKQLEFNVNTNTTPYLMISRSYKFFKLGYKISLAQYGKMVYKLLTTPLNKLFVVPDKNGY